MIHDRSIFSLYRASPRFSADRERFLLRDTPTASTSKRHNSVAAGLLCSPEVPQNESHGRFVFTDQVSSGPRTHLDADRRRSTDITQLSEQKQLVLTLSCCALLVGLLWVGSSAAQTLSEQPPPGANPDLAPVPPGPRHFTAPESGPPQEAEKGVQLGPLPVIPLPSDVLKRKMEDAAKHTTILPPTYEPKRWGTPNGLPPDEYRAPRTTKDARTNNTVTQD